MNAEKVLHAALDPLQPVAVTAFAGRLDPEKSLVVPELDNKKREVTGR